MLQDFIKQFSTPFGWMVQIIGILGMLSAVVSQQCRKNSLFYLFQGLCELLFSIQFILIGAWSGLMMNAIGVVRDALSLSGRKNQKKWILFLLIVASFCSYLVTVLVFKEVWWSALLPFLAFAGSTVVFWMRDGKKLRYCQLCLVSPAWLTYDILQMTVGGILCECFNILSAATSLVIHRKKGFTND